jgi:hypothetical protein
MARPHLWDRRKERTWRQRLARWQKSGLSGRDFCAREGFSEASFYGWRRTLAERDEQRAGTPQAAARPALPRPARRRSARPPAVPALVPVRLLSATLPVVDAGTAIELVLPGGSVLRLRPGFDADSVRELVALLQERGASC